MSDCLGSVGILMQRRTSHIKICNVLNFPKNIIFKLQIDFLNILFVTIILLGKQAINMLYMNYKIQFR